jgi:hypothetical protein
VGDAAGVQYYALPDNRSPYLLAAVRWPTISQAISAASPEWQEDPGLFDVPYSGHCVKLTPAQAAQVASHWGARLPSDAQWEAGTTLIRRMPSDWSVLAPAEKRAWALELVLKERPSNSKTHSRSRDMPHGPRVHFASWRFIFRALRHPLLVPELIAREQLASRLAFAAGDDRPSTTHDAELMVSSTGFPGPLELAGGPSLIDLVDGRDRQPSAS